jgi:hypothetical protein
MVDHRLICRQLLPIRHFRHAATIGRRSLWFLVYVLSIPPQCNEISLLQSSNVLSLDLLRTIA